ncbi:MAG: hypothetical protein RIF32_24320 [Leptospirales bacterium]|jgi:hypothetical protein
MRRKLERTLGKFAIENLTIYLTVLIAAVSTYAQFVDPGFGLLSFDALFVRGEFWQLFLFPFNMATGGATMGGAFWLLLLVYIFWLFASQLEAEIGGVAFNAYCFFAILCILVGHLLGDYFFGLGVNPYFLDLVILAAVCYRNPEQVIMLYFIIPVKLKWLAVLVFGAMGVFAIIDISRSGSLLPLWDPLFGMAAWFAFYGPEAARTMAWRGEQRVRKASYEARTAGVTVHRCTVCGLTERDDPHMDFRFCVDCADHEYCSEHLARHEHIKTEPR